MNSLLKSVGVILLLLIQFSCGKPEVNFSANKTILVVGEVVSFKDTDQKTRKTTYSYDFGDGSQITGINNPTHVYERAGSYVVTQQVTNTRNGKTASGTITITITSAEANFEISGTTAPTIGNSISFTNTTIEEGKGYPITYTWLIQKGSFYQTFESKNLVWVPESPGDYTITLSATQGLSTTSKTEELTVGGLNASSLQQMLSGTWIVSSDAKFEGNYGNSTCATQPPVWKNSYLEVNFNASGDVTYAIISNPDNLSGNVIGGNPGTFGIYFSNGQYAEIPTAFGYENGQGNAIGLYTVKSATESKIELERVVKTDVSTTCKYTDTYTIILSKKI
ncbi:MAG: PKD domain-containing protein [Bacteroidota bacterium]